jgi:ABC-type multidrug transport system fused ATPase/permease subunit
MQIYDNRLMIENFRSLDSFENQVLDEGEAGLGMVESVEFEHVSFKYPLTAQTVLEDVSFKIVKGKKTAFVGLNGSGKSTMIKLLLRMYDPDKGTIRINGMDIKEYALASLRSQFSCYFQDMPNYCFSLRENFTVSDEGLPGGDAKIIEALKDSCGSDILDKANGSLDTDLFRVFDPNGIELSGGQHQKLALARAIFRRHSALVLDEPSSNLDPMAEHGIFNSLRKLTEGKLTIFTSHRLSNISLADRVIVMEGGRVIEDGTQEELLRNGQRYAELFNYQRDKYQL